MVRQAVKSVMASKGAGKTLPASSLGWQGSLHLYSDWINRLIKTKKTRGRMLFAETWTLISFVDLTCSSQARILLHLTRSDRCPLGPEWAHQLDKHKFIRLYIVMEQLNFSSH